MHNCHSPASVESRQNQVQELLDELSKNLTPLERSTWERLMDGSSIAEIAGQDSIKCSAVYARIRGNSKGQGGMISKNEYVALWWSLHDKKKNYDSTDRKSARPLLRVN